MLGIRSVVAIVLAALSLSWNLATGQMRQVPEYHLKAVFLHRFASFVDWPSTSPSDSTFTIGILGSDPFGEALDVIETQRVGGLPIEVKRFSRLDELENTHILFVSSSANHLLGRILVAVGDHATLTVGEAANFASNGGIIRFITRDRQIRLEVNRCAAERAGLHISALLLQMAELTPGACGVPGP